MYGSNFYEDSICSVLFMQACFEKYFLTSMIYIMFIFGKKIYCAISCSQFLLIMIQT